MNPVDARRLRFGPFELALKAGELRRDGTSLKLQPQPFQVLALLASRAGEVVTREEIQEQVWGKDTFVDFESGLNFCIRQIRLTLGDDADHPRYLETIPRRGYRFKAEVEVVEPLPKPALFPANRHLRVRAAAAALALVGLGLGLWWSLSRRPESPPQWKVHQLTANPPENFINAAAISPDGKYVAYADQKELRVHVIETGEDDALPLPAEMRVWNVAWFPDSTRLVFQAATGEPTEFTFWVMSILSGAARKLPVGGWSPAVSPDGSLIAYTAGGKLGVGGVRVMGSEGENPRAVVEDLNSVFLQPTWSPDSRRLAYIRYVPTDVSAVVIETRPVAGGAARVLYSSPHLIKSFLSPLWWTRDNRILYAETETAFGRGRANLWEMRLDARSGQPAAPRRRLTFWPDSMMGKLSASADGHRLAMLQERVQDNILVGELGAGGTRLKAVRQLTDDERDDFPGAWAPDSRSLVFASNRRGHWDLFKQNLGQKEAELLAPFPFPFRRAHLSSDSGSVFYWVNSSPESDSPAATERLMRVALSGAPPELVATLPSANHEIRCPRRAGAACVLSRQEANELVFLSFEPGRNRQEELARIKIESGSRHEWDLSADGKRVAVVGLDSHLLVLSLSGGELRDIPLPSAIHLQFVAWAADGEKVFATGWWPRAKAGWQILQIDLAGRTRVLRQNETDAGISMPAPSPDGRYLAFAVETVRSDVVLLEEQ